MNISEQSRSAIVSSISEAVSRYKTGGENSVITDIHLQPRQETGELVIYNDDDELLSSTVIDEWMQYEGTDFYKDIEPIFREELVSMKNQGLFDKLNLLKPYSFVLVDDDKETVVELLLVDDEDTLLLSEELLKGLDEELDVFLKELLEK